MLRSLAIILVLANLAYMTWTHGWLYQAGLLPAPWPLTEPGRIAQQVRAEYIDIHREPKTADATVHPEPKAPPATESPASDTSTPGTQSPPEEQSAKTGTPGEVPRCVQLSGTLTERQFASIRMAVADALPDNAWTVSTSVQPARWIVYTGKYANADTLAVRKAELKQLQVEFRDVSAPNLQLGLAMGTYSTEAGAQQALRDVTKAGVKGAKVVIERPEATLYTFKLPEATDALQARFKRLMDDMPPDILKGKTLQACG